LDAAAERPIAFATRSDYGASRGGRCEDRRTSRQKVVVSDAIILPRDRNWNVPPPRLSSICLPKR